MIKKALVLLALFLIFTFPLFAQEGNDPLVQLTSPSDGSTVTPNTEVSLEATASSSTGVNRVVFHINGVHRCTDSTAPYTCVWDVPQNSGVSYKLTAWVIDNSGRKNSSSINVTSIPATITFLNNEPITTVTKDIPPGFKSITFNVTFSNFIINWAPQISFDNGATFLEQHRFRCGNTCAQVTIPLLSNKIRWSPGTSGGNATVIGTLNPEPDSQVLLLGQGINFPFTSSDFSTDGFSNITITAGGGTSIQAISLQKLENGAFIEKQRLNCDGGAECPLQSLPVLGGTYRIAIEGGGVNAVLGAILRKESSLPAPTATPTPTPTSGPTAPLLDNFDGPSLDTTLWEVFDNGGTYSFQNGFLVIPGGSSLPFFRAKNTSVFPNAPYEIEFGIQYTSALEGGTGVALSFNQQPNITPGWSNIPIAIWQGLQGFNIIGGGSYLYNISASNFQYHVAKIAYDGQKYTVYIDGNLVYTSAPTAAVNGLWFGHPSYCCTSGWTGFKLDYIKVTTN